MRFGWIRANKPARKPANAETVIHLITGTGFLIFAMSVFDFGLPRWVNVIGAAAAGAFGAIFDLQGVADVTHLEGLRYLAFDILGHEVERLLPDVVYLWFVALLLVSSRGKSRVLGWAVMLIVVSLEIATLASLLLGLSMLNVKVHILLPFVWLLFESAEHSQIAARSPAASTAAANLCPASRHAAEVLRLVSVRGQARIIRFLSSPQERRWPSGSWFDRSATTKATGCCGSCGAAQGR